MTNTPSYLQRFREKFPCSNKDCDNEGTFPAGNGDPCPCQYCHEVRLPFRDHITQERQQLIQEAVELGEGLKTDAEGWDGHRHNAAITVYQELIRTNLK